MFHYIYTNFIFALPHSRSKSLSHNFFCRWRCQERRRRWRLSGLARCLNGRSQSVCHSRPCCCLVRAHLELSVKLSCITTERYVKWKSKKIDHTNFLNLQPVKKFNFLDILVKCYLMNINWKLIETFSIERFVYFAKLEGISFLLKKISVFQRKIYFHGFLMFRGNFSNFLFSLLS